MPSPSPPLIFSSPPAPHPPHPASSSDMTSPRTVLAEVRLGGSPLFPCSALPPSHFFARPYLPLSSSSPGRSFIPHRYPYHYPNILSYLPLPMDMTTFTPFHVTSYLSPTHHTNPHPNPDPYSPLRSCCGSVDQTTDSQS